MLTPNCGCVVTNYKFICSDTVTVCFTCNIFLNCMLTIVQLVGGDLISLTMYQVCEKVHLKNGEVPQLSEHSLKRLFCKILINFIILKCKESVNVHKKFQTHIQESPNK